MLFYLLFSCKGYVSLLNVFGYVSFRAMVSLISALVSTWFFGRVFLRFTDQFAVASREHTPQAHRIKDTIPTAGGTTILAAVFLNSFLWTDLTDHHVWMVLGAMGLFGIIGLIDDMAKIVQFRGIEARYKFGLQAISAVIISCLFIQNGLSTDIFLPFFKQYIIPLGGWFVGWSSFVLIAMANGVNLTDGLDGLATSSLIPNFTIFGIISYLASHVIFANYLYIPHSGSAELAVMASIVIGSLLGFLWYNAYPAQMFMGDVGSLSLGAGLASIALVSKQELLLPVAGALFVVETISVIMQVLFFKISGKRFFKMAPIHHHFELLGWPESKITVRFGILSLLVCLIALMTLKMR